MTAKFPECARRFKRERRFTKILRKNHSRRKKKPNRGICAPHGEKGAKKTTKEPSTGEEGGAFRKNQKNPSS